MDATKSRHPRFAQMLGTDPKGSLMHDAIGRPLLAVAALLSLAVLAGCSSAPPEPAGMTTAEAAASPSPSPAASVSNDAPGRAIDLSAVLDPLEEEFAARVGVSAIDTDTGETVEHRADERFGFASTIKAFAAAELLRTVPLEERGEIVTWTQGDMDRAGYSPVTSAQASTGLTLTELAEAAVRDSDNTAMNLVLERLGGTAGLTDGLVRMGDSTTQVVDDEPGLNTVEPGSHDNTTTPAAFTANLLALRDPEILAAEDYDVLLDWMSGNATGDSLVRAGAPDDWAVADKSGGAGPRRNDVAIVTPPGREPIVITILTERRDQDAEHDDELVERVARAVLLELA